MSKGIFDAIKKIKEQIIILFQSLNNHCSFWRALYVLEEITLAKNEMEETMNSRLKTSISLFREELIKSYESKSRDIENSSPLVTNLKDLSTQKNEETKESPSKSQEYDSSWKDFIIQGYEYLFGFGAEKNSLKALDSMKNALESSDGDNSQVHKALGLFYTGEYSGKKDIEKAFQHLSKGAESNDKECWYRLSTLYEEFNLNEDLELEEFPKYRSAIEKSLFCLKKASILKHPEAITDLGYHSTEFYDKVRTYKMGKRLGSVRAINNLGMLYLRNSAENDKYSHKAFRNFMKSADYKDPKGTFHLGICFEKGIGTVRSLERAKRNFDESASLGFLQGKIFSLHYQLRDACNSDCFDDYLRVAISSFSLLKENSEIPEPLYYLAFLFRNGLGLSKDEAIADRLLEIARRMKKTENSLFYDEFFEEKQKSFFEEFYATE